MDIPRAQGGRIPQRSGQRETRESGEGVLEVKKGGASGRGDASKIRTKDARLWGSHWPLGDERSQQSWTQRLSLSGLRVREGKTTR